MRHVACPSRWERAGLHIAVFLGVVFAWVPPASGGSGEYLPVCNHPKCLNPQVTAKSGIGTAHASVEGKVTPQDAAKWCATYKPRNQYCPAEEVKSGGTGVRPLYRATADCITGRMIAIDGNTYTYAGVWTEGPGRGRPRFHSSNPRFPHTQWDETGAQFDPGGQGLIVGWGGGSPNLARQWELLCAGAPPPAVK